MNNEANDTTPAKQPKLVGITCNKQHILAWNYTDGCSVLVRADELKTEVWQVRVESGGKLRMMASIFGGRWTADRFCRFLRDGMSSRAKKLKKNPNRRARLAAATELEARVGVGETPPSNSNSNLQLPNP